jgi:hypothetical protein
VKAGEGRGRRVGGRLIENIMFELSNIKVINVHVNICVVESQIHT